MFSLFLSCSIILSGPTPSFAFPFAPSPCHDSGSDRSLRTLVAYYGPVDNRKLITQGGKELGLSDQEIAHLREVTGVIICPSPNGKTGWFSSATLESGGDRILTAAHNFNQNKDNNIQFEKCYFQNQATPPKSSFFSLDSKNKPNVMYNSGWPSDPIADYAVVKLQTPFHVKNPFPFDFSGRRLTPNDKIIVVSGAQKHFDNHSFSEPIVQQCSSPDSAVNTTTVYYTNCALFHQASGSIGYVRNGDGVLSQKIIANSIGTENNSEEYDFKKVQYSKLLGLDRAFFEDAKTFGLGAQSHSN